MTFGQAIEAAKAGAKIAREGWNGNGIFVCLSPGAEDLPAERFWSPALREYFAAAGKGTVRPYLVIKSVDGSIVPWLASQTDMLAEDWQIV